MRRRGGRFVKIAAGIAAAVLLLLVLAQIALPSIAASRIRSRIGRYGSVRSVRVSAWPAIELLWGDADTVHVEADRLSLSPEQAAKLVAEAKGAGTVDATAAHVDLSGLQLSDATLSKAGSELSAGGVASAAAVRAALPAGVTVSLLRSSPGGVLVEVHGGLFGTRRPLRVLASTSSGRLVARPLGGGLGDPRLTLFSDPRIAVDGVGAQAVGRGPAAYLLTLRGRMR